MLLLQITQNGEKEYFNAGSSTRIYKKIKLSLTERGLNIDKLHMDSEASFKKYIAKLPLGYKYRESYSGVGITVLKTIGLATNGTNIEE